MQRTGIDTRSIRNLQRMHQQMVHLSHMYVDLIIVLLVTPPFVCDIVRVQITFIFRNQLLILINQLLPLRLNFLFLLVQFPPILNILLLQLELEVLHQLLTNLRLHFVLELDSHGVFKHIGHIARHSLQCMQIHRSRLYMFMTRSSTVRRLWTRIRRRSIRLHKQRIILQFVIRCTITLRSLRLLRFDIATVSTRLDIICRKRARTACLIT
mmetsp:Transcript_26008/g.41242  ORF Transcript_26008/g.41242 Transcript_26008/m.41242 type:complete len:211 (+) Transcript_26008:205-837(+)